MDTGDRTGYRIYGTGSERGDRRQSTQHTGRDKLLNLEGSVGISVHKGGAMILTLR